MFHTGLEAPQGVWWEKLKGSERVWVGISFVWCLVLFAMMPLWHIRGGQNPAGIRHTVEPAAFQARVQEFIDEYQVGTDSNIPVVEPPPGSDIYLQAAMWSWRPVLRLQRGAEYILHLSSLDVNHGFSLYPLNINFQIVPGFDYGLRVTPDETGEFHIVCNEFCGVGHHLMVGKVIVIDPPAGADNSGSSSEVAAVGGGS